MKLVHSDYSFQIEFKEGYATELIIEEPHLFSSFIFELLQQLEGEEGRFVLSHENDLIKLPYKIECIVNPFGLEINQKKILTKLYNLIKQEVMSSDLMIQLGDTHTALIEMMNTIQEHIDYPIYFKEEFDIIALLKYMDVKLIDLNGSILEQIIDYSMLLNQLMGQNIFILVNIQSYLKDREIDELLKHSSYQKIYFIFLESMDRGLVRKYVKKIIVDNDKCEIF